MSKKERKPKENKPEKKAIPRKLLMILGFAVLVICIVVVVILLTRHHHTFTEATCNSPAVCTGCGAMRGDALGHDFAPATCTKPSTCTRCGITTGEALGHSYREATCTEPATCYICGQTNGVAYGHVITAANYQQGECCSVCGMVFSSPLTADFEKLALASDSFCVEGLPYDYETSCKNDSSLTTTGEVAYYDYSRNLLDSSLEVLPGYEWMSVTVSLTFEDENARTYGMSWSICNTDYYDMQGYEDSKVKISENEYSFHVNWKGKDYSDCKIINSLISSGWKGSTYEVEYTYLYRVPTGYDGMVLCLKNRSLETKETENRSLYEIADLNLFTDFFRLSME